MRIDIIRRENIHYVTNGPSILSKIFKKTAREFLIFVKAKFKIMPERKIII